MNYDERIKLRVFEGKSTYQNDYRHVIPSKDIPKTVRYEDEPQLPDKPQEFECHESLTKFQKYVPFNLYWNPIKELNEETMMIDRDLEEAIKTRPRTYIAPAASLDDVPDKEMRALLVDYIYTTDWKAAERETYRLIKMRQLVGEQTVEKDTDERLVPVLPVNWEKRMPNWDYPQLRAMVDTNVAFWEHKDPPVVCTACVDRTKELVPDALKEEIAEAIRTDMLRLPHDIEKPGYCGHMPLSTGRLPIRKTVFPVVHPLVSTNQALDIRKKGDPENKCVSSEE